MTLTISSFLSGETTFALRHFAWSGKTDFVFQIAIPAQGLLVWSGIDNGFVVDSVLPNEISLASVHDFAARIRRTEVRPICNRRAISDWLTPAR
jgi:hypothetical protein